MKSILAIILMIIFLSSCASTSYEPILDGQSNQLYIADLEVCRELANKHRNVTESAKSGVLFGAGLGAIIGAADDSSNDGEDALAGAVVGATVVGLGATSDMRDENKSLIVECMQGRGHRVIG